MNSSLKIKSIVFHSSVKVFKNLFSELRCFPFVWPVPGVCVVKEYRQRSASEYLVILRVKKVQPGLRFRLNSARDIKVNILNANIFVDKKS